MAHRTWCDNCGNEIRHEPDEVNKDNADWKPDMQAQLTIRIVNNGRQPVSMDLCGRCVRAYVKHLAKPLPVIKQ